MMVSKISTSEKYLFNRLTKQRNPVSRLSVIRFTLFVIRYFGGMIRNSE